MTRRDDGLLQFPLQALPGRSSGAVRHLAERVRALPFGLHERGAVICGGSVLRVMIGQLADSTATQPDLDVFFTDADAVAGVVAALREAKWHHKIAGLMAGGSGGGERSGPSGKWLRGDDVVDLVARFAAPMHRILASFDVVACSVATDGESIFATPAAWEDIALRRLRVRRETRPDRLTKWVRAGLFPENIDPDAFLTEHLAGWVDINASVDAATVIATGRDPRRTSTDTASSHGPVPPADTAKGSS